VSLLSATLWLQSDVLDFLPVPLAHLTILSATQQAPCFAATWQTAPSIKGSSGRRAALAVSDGLHRCPLWLVTQSRPWQQPGCWVLQADVGSEQVLQRLRAAAVGNSPPVGSAALAPSPRAVNVLQGCFSSWAWMCFVLRCTSCTKAMERGGNHETQGIASCI